MKAKEYCEKYSHRLFGTGKSKDDLDDIVLEILRDFNQEVVELVENRKAETNVAMAGIVLELNQKWNAVVNGFVAGHGISPIMTDGYKRFWIIQLPELEPYLEKKRR